MKGLFCSYICAVYKNKSIFKYFINYGMLELNHTFWTCVSNSASNNKHLRQHEASSKIIKKGKFVLGKF